VQTEKKEWFCPRCRAAWTQFEVLDKVGPHGFECHTCGAVLKHDPSRTEVGHEESTRLNTQFQFITDKLREIDAIRIPDNTFDLAYANRREVIRDATNPVTASVVVDPGTKRPSAVHGLQNTGPKSMTVNISTNEGPSEAELAAEKTRKEKIAKQNEMPSWMKASTVTGESFSGSVAEDGLAKKEEAETKDQALAQEHHAEVDDLFARIRAQQAAEQANQHAADSGSDEDEDEGDFEDVVASNGDAGIPPGLPAITTPAATQPRSPVKRSLAEGHSTPVNEGRQTKKVKVEDPPAKENDEGESEEELEFEDV
jgi:transcription initiation factor TFIIE subunit alpha